MRNNKNNLLCDVDMSNVGRINELVEKIMSYCDLLTWGKMRQVCKEWNALASNQTVKRRIEGDLLQMSGVVNTLLELAPEYDSRSEFEGDCGDFSECTLNEIYVDPYLTAGLRYNTNTGDRYYFIRRINTDNRGETITYIDNYDECNRIQQLFDKWVFDFE